MDESRKWLTKDGRPWHVYATLQEQHATPLIDGRTVRVSDGSYPRIRNSRVRTRRVHPDVMRRMMEASDVVD